MTDPSTCTAIVVKVKGHVRMRMKVSRYLSETALVSSAGAKGDF